MTIPRWGTTREARRFADSQRAWIERARARAAREAVAPRDELPPDALEALRTGARGGLTTRLLELAAELGLRVARVSIRNQKWRWGSCSANGHICLNWRLAHVPAWVRDYVLVHELMHLRRLDHSRAFWRLVAARCPEYREARAWLRASDGLRRPFSMDGVEPIRIE